MSNKTLGDHLQRWRTERGDRPWLRERQGEQLFEWSWERAGSEIDAVAAWLEQRYGARGARMGLLSRNRAHWFLADLAIMASGNITVPLFTTLPQDTAQYILEFAGVSVLFLGEATNWGHIAPVVPESVDIITLPGVACERRHIRWEDILREAAGSRPAHRGAYDDTISLVFTSGTTGLPKGSIQTHRSMTVPIERFQGRLDVSPDTRFFSYLPLSHIAERQLVMINSLLCGGATFFNESLLTLLRDLGEVRPHFMFGPPRVWEQLQQVVIGMFGSAAALEQALAQDAAATAAKVRQVLGLDQAIYLVTAAAPTPPALIHWFDRFDLRLTEGYGQTEAMGLIANSLEERRIGSIGKPADGVEIRLGPDDELLVRADGCSPGYYNRPDKTAELVVDGWLHTGDKARIDEDGYVYITGRVKDYFKTIQGKFVAPVPIESEFADNPYTEQICLLGRGYSKTVMVCVLSALAQKADRAEVEQALRRRAEAVNEGVEKHARIGAVIIAVEPWTIENHILTPTLKIRREQVEQRFGEIAEPLARQAAEQGELLATWAN